MPRMLALTAPRTLEYVEVETPTPGRGEVRVRSVVSGISHGTELNLYRGTSPFATKRFDRDRRVFVPAEEEDVGGPRGLGYEMVGEVVEVGPKVDRVAVGDLVHTMSNHREEAVVDLAVSDGYPPVRLPTGRKPERGLFLSLGCVALLAVRDAGIKVGDTVVVSGAGVIGQLAAQLARMNGAEQVVVADPNESRRALAERLGATATVDPTPDASGAGPLVRSALGTAGADIAIDTSGAYAGLQGAIASVAMAGTVVAAGFYQGGGTDLRLGEEWHHNRPTMISSMGAWGCPHRDHPRWDSQRLMETVCRLVYDGRLVVEPLLTETIPFDRATEAYQRLDVDQESALKIALRY